MTWERLIEIFQSWPEFFKRLELVKWNFDGCDWRWQKKCSNLCEFAITSPPQILIPDILGTDDDGEITSMPYFYFHPDKSSVVYDRPPPVVIQSRVTQPLPNYPELLLKIWE
ncbi:2862_t:CDS:2, partial [Entrophospora sp. SA101]